MKIFTAGVAVADGFDGDNLLFTSKSLVNSTLKIAVSSVDIAGGNGNMLFGKYYHTSKVDADLEDVLFDLNYFALNVGNELPEFGGDILKTETIKSNPGGTLILSKKVNDGEIIQYHKVGEEDWLQKTVENSSTQSAISNLEHDTTYCVKYFYFDSNAKKLSIPASIIPRSIKLVMTINLYAGDIEKIDAPGTNKIGKLQITIPRFLLAGSQDLSLTATGAVHTKLSGSALATMVEGCEDDGVYAVLTQLIDGDTWQSNTKMLSIDDEDVNISVGDSEQVDVYAISKDNRAWKPNPSDLTFTSTATSKFTVNSVGVITGASTGTGILRVAITSDTSIYTTALVTVVS